MKSLVINADDFGLTGGVCAGIVKAIEAGVLTATTAMMCVPGSRVRVARWGPAITGRIGLHLQLTSGRPVLKPALIPSLVRPDGTFPQSRKEPFQRNTKEIVLEWHAQMHALQDAGVQPTHLDSHHHIHLQPDVIDAYREFASYYGIPARAVSEKCAARLRSAKVLTVDRTLTSWFGGELTASYLLEVVQAGCEGLDDPCSLELMTHPGIVDHELAPLTKYVNDRERELATLCQPGLAKQLKQAGFDLVTFQELRRRTLEVAHLREVRTLTAER